ncbi:brassinosteroid-responsive RING protein 1-like [Aristolochia californica]|uniref:brassinosteroid-responsive RING protein 1-like n=1 Tax=Aristolochia californica TaxID=171875 RepID=UPI0035D9258F
MSSLAEETMKSEKTLVIWLDELRQAGVETLDSCAVCVYEFEAGEEGIQQLTNCRNIFQRSYLDRWMDNDRKIWPLWCWMPFIFDEMQDFNECIWVAAGD